MASHGIPRSAEPQQQSEEARAKERKDIAEYRLLVEDVARKVDQRDFSPELLQQTAALLSKNPEYYTMWNLRRRIYVAEFENLAQSASKEEISIQNKCDQILQIIQLDLQFLFPLLLKFPKCYWIWNHRLWLLKQASSLLPAETASNIWQDELALVGKMLSRDNRNFHGWGYRRTVIENLESHGLQGSSMARTEYDYTTKMIGNNLSNFSAWHNRSKLIIRMLDEESANSAERRSMLDSELDLIHNALFDPYDQSLWFYHQNLITAFDPAWSSKSMAPGLTAEDRIAYLRKERIFLEEVLEDADDCKWAYQALVECALTEAKIEGTLGSDMKSAIRAWIQKLMSLDPLRGGRWSDMEAALLQEK